MLTSAGFESPAVMGKFLELLEKEPKKAKALFIPTAAIDDGAKAMLPKCWGDLINAGLLEPNITTYDLDRPMTAEELKNFDAVYVCGGVTEYLLERMLSAGFDKTLGEGLENGPVYVGVSAGSAVCAQNLSGNLGYLPRRLEVHCETGSPAGALPDGTVYLTNAQAVCAAGGEMEVL